MPHEQSDYDVPIELVFDITKTSGQMKFLGLSQKSDESDNELVGLFDWTCQACRTVSRDTVVLKRHQVFFARWTCSSCSRVTLVRFRARAVAEWIAQHTAAVTGTPIAVRDQDNRGAICVVCGGRHPGRGRQMTFAWIAVPALAVIILLGLLDVRRVRHSSAAPQASEDSTSSGTRQQQSSRTPSARIVGYWVSASKDHVMHFGPVDPVLHEGAYIIVRRGGKQPELVRFKVVHEDTAGEQIVIRKEKTGGDKLVIQQTGAEITYRLQSEAAEVTLNVAHDGKSMTRVEVRDGEPTMTVYSNAGETANR